MPHPLSGRCRASGDVRVDWLLDSLRTLRGLLLRRPTNLADNDDSLRGSVLRKEFQGLGHARADYGVTADPDARGLPEARVRDRVHDLIRQGPAAGDHSDVPGLEDVIRHDPRLRFPRGRDARAVRPDYATAPRPRVRHDVQAIVE